ncbi:MAG: YicC family protein, partial [Verrucomicrobia bacterium]|nr:YicC family protein [Verrucomicrobiota bacterium]
FLMQYLPSSKIKGSIGPLQVCVKEAIEGLLAMKTAEGQALAKDLKHRLRELERMLADVQKHSPDATQKMRTRLHDKIAEVMQVGPELEERLLREVALFAERVDIAEEITRFLSHTEQFQQLLKGDLVGRKMDFLLQEMNREVNTIGSKSMDVNITRLVVSMKSELEKMREQVQNIE